MATLKRRLARKNASGIYEPVHLETSSGLVICPDGTNLDIALNKKSPIDHTHTGFALAGHTHDIYVPTSRTINGKPLTGNITLAAGDVGAAASGHTHTLSSLGAAAASHTHNGYVPTSRTINGKALSGNITLGATDVSAVPTTRTINGKPLSSNITLTPEDIGAASIDQLSSAGGLSNMISSNICISTRTDGTVENKYTITWPTIPTSISSKPFINIINDNYTHSMNSGDGVVSNILNETVYLIPGEVHTIPIWCMFLTASRGRRSYQIAKCAITLSNTGILSFAIIDKTTTSKISEYFKQFGDLKNDQAFVDNIIISQIIC